MSPFTPMAQITERDIQDAARSTLAAGADPQVMGTFLALIDWSGPQTAIQDRLSELLAWTDWYADGRITEQEWISCLQSLLPAAERTTGVRVAEEESPFRVDPGNA